LIYQGLEEENLDQKAPGPQGWGLMQRASSTLITKKQEMLNNETPNSLFFLKIQKSCSTMCSRLVSGSATKPFYGRIL
jgi:hypothetical protein